ncbi:STAS domain-containing protein [Actinokineospora diospyrosa]|uniref:Anti-anti-sigma factor n=1 Tax=Actinokineospora diospyrosa TaxID=103728 RepID=A0ABT1IF54_9PSEU|nr:STAS domain-containing protein [Actinokineospora diospyrosa]MCP2271250.1 anti-anti-sigma factor [Actinokineospora diospyrosa]
MRPLLAFASTVGPGYTALTVSGEVDMSSAHLLDQELRAAQADRGTVILDLTAVRFLSGAGVDVILTAAQRAAETGTRFAVVAPADEPAHRTITLAGLTAPAESIPAALSDADHEPLT